MNDFDFYNNRYSYDPLTGLLSNKGGRSGAIEGRVVGYLNPNGYVMVRIHKIGNVRAHRIAWLLTHGEWPDNEIDHINGVCHDNRLENLRVVTHKENMHNTKTARINNARGGFIGANWHEKSKKWRARICVNRKSKYLGLFNSAEAAHAAYVKGKHELHPTHMRLR